MGRRLSKRPPTRHSLATAIESAIPFKGHPPGTPLPPPLNLRFLSTLDTPVAKQEFGGDDAVVVAMASSGVVQVLAATPGRDLIGQNRHSANVRIRRCARPIIQFVRIGMFCTRHRSGQNVNRRIQRRPGNPRDEYRMINHPVGEAFVPDTQRKFRQRRYIAILTRTRSEILVRLLEVFRTHRAEPHGHDQTIRPHVRDHGE